VDVAARDTGLQRIERAVELTESSNTYRVRGVLAGSSPVVEWKGIVVGADEQYLVRTAGLLIDSRRIDGVHWARRLEPVEPWSTAPSGTPIDLAVLLQGSEVHAEHRGGQWLITLRFDGVDVLAALAHIRSTGPITADVALEDDAIAQVALHLSGNTTADLSFSDYGAALTVDPVDAPSSLAPG
jgi:hypothetical protein